MHILIDLQAAQAANRDRGIGRCAKALALALTKRATPEHQVSILLNTAFPDACDQIREDFSQLPRKPSFAFWRPLTPTYSGNPRNAWRRQISEKLYENVVANLSPDALLIPSLFEGFGDDAVVSIQNHAPRSRPR